MKPRYKRMLQGLAAKSTKGRKRRARPWFVYILQCADGTLYTGITNDLERRIEEHNTGRGARYTRSRTPVALRYAQTCPDRSAALIREAAIKNLSRPAKDKLIASQPVE